jgi:glucan phosphoethanolaminetransferase (alkaline phosphatase superfamily)
MLVHLYDSHAPYVDRYPSMPEPHDFDNERLEALRYERANEHTLAVLSKISTMIDALPRPAFAIYVADHGENLLVDHNGLHYHIGARVTTRSGYVPAFVFWNKAFRDTYRPIERLQPLLAAPSLAHVDVYNLWMNFSGLPVELSATADPKILGKVRVTDTLGAVSCSSLPP